VFRFTYFNEKTTFSRSKPANQFLTPPPGVVLSKSIIGIAGLGTGIILVKHHLIFQVNLY
jgi:hypothetical protein